MRRFVLGLAAITFTQICFAQTKLRWQGYAWNVREATAQGPGPNNWSQSNVWLDSRGDLHLKINNSGGKWSCAEISSEKPMTFGTYQCQVATSIDHLDANVIFSMFSYQGPDNVKEIDIEYAKWGNPKESNAWWTVYPNDLTGKKTSQGFTFKQDSLLTTSRFIWSKSGVYYSLFNGFQAISSRKDLIKEWNDTPANSDHSITQTPMPLHFNLWLFEGKAPLDGKPVEIVLHSFTKT